MTFFIVVVVWFLVAIVGGWIIAQCIREMDTPGEQAERSADKSLRDANKY